MDLFQIQRYQWLAHYTKAPTPKTKNLSLHLPLVYSPLPTTGGFNMKPQHDDTKIEWKKRHGLLGNAQRHYRFFNYCVQHLKISRLPKKIIELLQPLYVTRPKTPTNGDARVFVTISLDFLANGNHLLCASCKNKAHLSTEVYSKLLRKTPLGTNNRY